MKKHIFISKILILLFMSFILLSGCGALVTAIIQAILGTKLGFIAIPAIAAAGAEASQAENMPGIIILPENNPPEGYSTVQGATVTIDGSSEVITTDENGFFKFEEIPVGLRNLTVEYAGFETIRQQVTVSEDDSGQRPVTGFKIVPDGPLTLSLLKGTIEIPQANFYFDTYGLDPNGTTIRPEATWQISPSDTDTVTTGEAFSFRTTEPGRYTVTATSTQDTSQTDTVEITVVEGTVTLYGQVTENLHNEPVAGAAVILEESNLITETDCSGNYILTGVPASTVIEVTATLGGARGSTAVTEVNPSGTIEANIVIKSSIFTTPTYFTGTGNIEGTTFDTNGSPMGNTFVAFYSLNNLSSADISTLATPEKTVTADGNGNFYFSNMTAGQCRVEFWQNEADYNSYPGNPLGGENGEVKAGTTSRINITAGSSPSPSPTPSPSPSPSPTSTATKVDLQSYFSSYSGSYSSSPNYLHLIVTPNSSITSLSLNDVEILEEDNSGFPFSDISGSSVFNSTPTYIPWNDTTLANGIRFVHPGAGTYMTEGQQLDIYLDFSTDQTPFFATGKVIRLHFTSDGVNQGYLDITL